MTEDLLYLFLRDFDRLQEEVEAYPQDSDLWLVKGEINNSAGNLCLHICGNLQHFIGKVLGSSDYQRDRVFEFSAKNVSKAQLIKEIENTSLSVKSTLVNLDQSLLSKPFPVQFFEIEFSTLRMLIHLQGHLNYHLGQINYHRRLIINH